MMLALVTFALAALPQVSVPGNVEVSIVRSVDGELLASVRATQTPIDTIITRLIEEQQVVDPANALTLEGFLPSYRAILTSVELQDRPLRSAIEFALGSVGLEAQYRAGTLTVKQSDSSAETAEQLRDRAKDIYDRAVLKFPDHSASAGARLHQGVIEEARGNLTGALLHYEALREIYRSSGLIPTALWRSGLVYEQMGLWNDANSTFLRLANADVDHEYKASARLGAARCAVQLGNPDLALRTLDALDRRFPPTTLLEELERELVRADAFQAAAQPVDALRTLERLLQNDLSREHKVAIVRIQALALEAIGETVHAQRAWSIYAHETSGQNRLLALESAARLALSNGDEVSTIFLGKLAENAGDAEALKPYVVAAMEHLGLRSEAPTDDTYTPEQTIAHARSLIELGEADEAHRRLLPLRKSSEALAAETQLNLTEVWARVIEQRRGVESALREIREARALLTDIEDVRRLDLLAAELLENNERFAEAADAYEGRY